MRDRPNRFSQGLLTALLASATACPQPALALRPISLRENAGAEEQLRASFSGAEEPVIAAWDEKRSKTFQSRMLQEFGGALTEDFRSFLPLSYGIRPIVVAAERYGVERWGDFGAKGNGEVYWVRSGPLFFVDARQSASLSSGLKAEMGPHLLTVPDLKEYSVSHLHDEKKEKFGSHTHASLLAILHSDLRDLAVVDLGAGDGVLALAAFRRGAGPLILVEKNVQQMEQAGALLIRNGLREGKDFHLLNMDLKDAEGIAREVERWVGPHGKIALIMNVGTWPGFYEVTNAEGIALAQRLPQVDRFIAGGYMGSISGTVWRWTPREALPGDQVALRALGFKMDLDERGQPKFSSFLDSKSEMNAVAFSASRSVAGNSAGAEERMTPEEFLQSYGPEALAEAGPRAEQVLDWLGKADAQATVVEMPRFAVLYPQGSALELAVEQKFLPRANAGAGKTKIRFSAVPLGKIEHWHSMGMILHDPMLTMPGNPKGLPMRDVRIEEVERLDPNDLLAQIFRSRLGIPASEFLGAVRFTDRQGGERLVLFSAA